MERIRYLTKKAQKSVITPEERDELAYLLGRDPVEFQEPNGLDVLISIALVAIAAAIILWLLSESE